MFRNAHRIRWAACAALSLVFLPACGSGGGSSGGDGFGSVRLAMSGAACTTLQNAEVIAKVTIAFSGDEEIDGLEFDRAELLDHCANEQDSPLAQLEDVAVGHYTAEAQALRADDVVIGEGSEEFDVFHAETTNVSITVTAVEGKGDVNVDISFEGDWSGLDSPDDD